MKPNEIWCMLRERAKCLFLRRQMERDLDDEIAFHLAMRAEKQAAEGLPPAEAEWAAQRRFGNATYIRENCRDAWTFAWLENLYIDMKQVVRFLKRNPGFAAAAVLSLALGIGANTVMFSVVRTVFLKPLPWSDSEQIIRMSLREEGNPNWQNSFFPLSRKGFEAWRDGCTLCSHVAGVKLMPIGLSLTGSGEAEHFDGQAVSSNFFDLLGTAPVIGRTFLPKEDQPGHDNVAVLSHAVWKERFGGDPAIVGRTLMLNGQEITVVGVMPAGFSTPAWLRRAPANIWLPLSPARGVAGGGRFIGVLGRVKPGVTPQQAESEASAIIAGIEPKFLCTAKPLTSDSDSAKPWMALLFAVTALVLLVACANVANMTLARAATRIRESGIRAALGAGKLRLARQFILESAALAVIAGVASLLLAQGAMALLRHIQPTGLPRAAELRLDWGVFGFALLLALVVAVVIGALPALQAARMEILELLNMGGARAGEHGLVRRSRDVLIAIQVALSVILLVGAGIMMRSLLEVSAVDLGFDAHNVLIFKLKAPEQWPMDKTRNFYVRLREKIGAVAGVEDVSYTNSSPPLEAASSLDVIADGSRTTPNRPVLTLFRRISPGYFRALGIPIIQGEDITERQLEVSNRDVLVNEAFVQQHWPGEDPLGRMVYLGNRISEEQKARIIGVAKNVKEGNITNSDWPEIYFPYAGDSNETMIGVRTDGAPLKFATAIRKAVTATDPAIAIYDMRTMEQVVDKALASQTFLAGFLGLFAGIATILAMIGIYGVVSYTARRRTHEIGIRLALGATRWSILRLLGGHYLIVTAIGLVIGVAGSVLLTKLIQAFLYRMTPYDPWTLACVVALLLATAGIAAWLPARRAASMDPMLALKCE